MLGTKKLSTKVNQSNSNICENIANCNICLGRNRHKILNKIPQKYENCSCCCFRKDETGLCNVQFVNQTSVTFSPIRQKYNNVMLNVKLQLTLKVSIA